MGVGVGFSIAILAVVDRLRGGLIQTSQDVLRVDERDYPVEVDGASKAVVHPE